MEHEGLTRRGALLAGGLLVAARGLRLPDLALAAAPRSRGFAMDVDLDRDGGAARAARAGWIETRPLRAPARFDLVALAWRSAPARLAVELRVRRAGRPWGPWVRAPAAGSHAPDGDGGLFQTAASGSEGRAQGRTAPHGSEPVWAGGADLVQLRLSAPVRGLRLRFVDAYGGAIARAAARRPRAVAHPGFGAPPLVPRSEWADRACTPRVPPSYGEIELAFVHHTVNANDYGPEDSAAMVRAICHFHIHGNGWNDIGYNFLVDRYGQIFEGRAGGIAAAVIGAQAQGYNSLSTGVANLGTFASVDQTDAGFDALARLIAWKLPLHGVPVRGKVTVVSGGGASNRYRYGTKVTLQRISGHRDGDETECPGNDLYRHLPRLRRMVARRAQPLSRLTCELAEPDVAYGDRVQASGRLRGPDGSPVAGATIQLQVRRRNGFRRVARAKTDDDGRWSASALVRRDRDLRAYYPGRARDAAGRRARRVLSEPVALHVLPQVEIATWPKLVRPGHRVAVRGRVRPTPAAVRLIVERRTRRRGRLLYERVSVERVDHGRDGRFGPAHVRLERPGLYRIRLAPLDGVPHGERHLWPGAEVRCARA